MEDRDVVRGAPPPVLDLPAYYSGGVITGSYLGPFFLPFDADPYDYFPYQQVFFCLQTRTAFDVDPECDDFSFTEPYGTTHGIVPFREALDPLRGQEVMLWLQALNLATNTFDVSYARPMRAALSNIALQPPGHESEEPFLNVYPSPLTSGFDDIDGWSFRWPLVTTGLAAPWGGVNGNATKHILRMQLTQSSAICEKQTYACPAADGTCSSLDPLDCSEAQRGECNYTDDCSISASTTFEIPVAALTSSPVDVGDGRARLNFTVGSGSHVYVEFFPDLEAYEHLFDDLSPDKVIWSVATCTNVATKNDGTVEVCGRTESGFAHYSVGQIGFVGDGGDGGGGGLPNIGPPFAQSPLVDTFSHPACIDCHIIERQATATPPTGRGAAHLPFIGNNPANFTNPASCSGCHGSNLAPDVIGTAYATAHDLPADVDSWWAWFAPEYEGGLEWPEFLEDPEGPDFDPATACVLFRGETPDAASMRHHLFEDPRVIWSIVGGDKPNNNFVAELAPPGSLLDNLSTQAEILAALAVWEEWVDEWVDGGMNCGSTLTGSSAGGGSNEQVNTTPPTTTSNGSSGTWVGGAVGSGDTTIAHLDCNPDQDSASDSCAWTFFACGSDDVQVAAQIATCDEASATPYLQGSVDPAGLCDQAASGCHGFEPGVGGGQYWGLVEIPAEVGDHTRLSFFSLDAENNREIVRTEAYDFVEADLTAPTSSAELFYDVAADEHKLRFSCEDNSEVCMIFFEVLDPGEEDAPEFDMSTNLLNSNGNAFDSDGNVLGFLGDTQVRRIRWAAIDGAAGQKNAEFDRQCFEDQLQLCPGKLAFRDQCIATCEDSVRSGCQSTCSGSGSSGGVEEECVEICVATSGVDCSVGCEQTCDNTKTLCPGDEPGFYPETGCVSRTAPIQCYHEFVYDPVAAYDRDPPEVRAQPLEEAPPSGVWDAGFDVALICGDPVNECEIFYTLDGTDPTDDDRLRYTEALHVPRPLLGRTATTTVKFFAMDDAVPPNRTSIQTVTYTVVLPHTDDDGDGFTEDQGDCNDDASGIFPGAVEVCNGIDDDCNGTIDDDAGATCPAGDLIFGDGFESGSTSAWG